MSDLKVPGYKASVIIQGVRDAFASFTEAQRQAQINKTNAMFEIHVTKAGGPEEAVWTIDLKKTGDVYKGPAQPKADVTLTLGDEAFADLASGKLNGQKAFMTGKLKTKGNVLLATKLEALLRLQPPKAKL